MAHEEPRKKDGMDSKKKRRRMREEQALRRAHSMTAKGTTDEVDKIKYKQGSAGDRTRRGAV